MAHNQLVYLPEELLGAIINQTSSAEDTVYFGLACKRLHQLAVTSPVWRRHCLSTWYSWDASYDLQTKLGHKPLQNDWRALFLKRSKINRNAGQLFESLLLTQQARASRMNELAVLGLDVFDQLKKISEHTPDNADDVLARRWHADAILKMMARRRAIEVWAKLQRGEHVELEDALIAYDDFILGRTLSVEHMNSWLDNIASDIRTGFADFADMTIREKAECIAEYLRDEGFVGMPSLDDYHALRNNFISLALDNTEDEAKRGCLPLQSVAIYCAVARRLGLDAQPSNFPRHVHAVITAPAEVTLDGEQRMEVDEYSSDPEMMHMDPFRQDVEVPQGELLGQLSRIGVPPSQYNEFLGPASVLEMVLRTGRNILVSVEGLHMPGQDDPDAGRYQHPDPDLAKYAALWSLFIQGDSIPAVATTRRRQAIRYLLEKFQSDLSQDVDLFAETAPPLLEGLPELPLVMALIQDMIASGRAPRVPVLRPIANEDPVRHRIGTFFNHRRYHYHGFIVGWSPTCAASANWITQMRVDDLPRGRHQPFYNIVAADKTIRYVAEENIAPLTSSPPEALMQQAGRYFKRWDAESGRFVSNMRDEYPDD